jgi:hypothetical protein
MRYPSVNEVALLKSEIIKKRILLLDNNQALFSSVHAVILRGTFPYYPHIHAYFPRFSD